MKSHFDHRPGDYRSLLLWAEGDELARLERVFRTTQNEYVDFIIDDRESDDGPRPHCDRVIGSTDRAARLAAARADRPETKP